MQTSTLRRNRRLVTDRVITMRSEKPSTMKRDPSETVNWLRRSIDTNDEIIRGIRRSKQGNLDEFDRLDIDKLSRENAKYLREIGRIKFGLQAKKAS